MTAMTSNCAAGDTEVLPKRPTKERAGGDLFMTLIQTAEWWGANSFDYLTELQRMSRSCKPRPMYGRPGTAARGWRGPDFPIPFTLQ